jgi:hypothetical protein
VDDLYVLPVDVMEEYWKGDCDLRSVVDEVYNTSFRLPGVKGGGDTGVCGAGVRCNGLIRRGCGPAVGQWDDQDGKASAGRAKDSGVGQGCPLPGWGFLRLVGWQYRKIN